MTKVPTMIDVDRALALVRAHVTAGPIETVGIDAALYRILAEPICCDVDYPPFDRAVMDGYAVRAEDTAAAPLTLQIVGQVPAGVVSDRLLQPGEAMQINTGAPMPRGADAVVRVEETELRENGKSVLIRVSVGPGQFVTPRATYVPSGAVILKAGMRLTPAEIGAAAAAGAARLSVFRRPRVAILSTGNELVEVDRMPTGGQIRNSNQHQLDALVRSAHAEPVVLGVARDDPDELRAKIEAGLSSDLLLVSGGVSMGAFDQVPEVLAACGVTARFHKMAIKPGRPTMCGTTEDGALVFALPGNPVSAFVGFELLVRPAIGWRQGALDAEPRYMAATLHGTISSTRNRRSYIPARAAVNEAGEWFAEPTRWHGSGDAFGLIGANAMIVRPPNAPAIEHGAQVSMLLLRP
jgi:molybdopterin molybdotransferase